MGYQQSICGLWGFYPQTPAAGLNGFLLNASTNYIAFSFVAQAATSLSTFRFFNNTGNHGTNGTPACRLYADAGSGPNLGGGALDTLTVGTIAANSWVSCTGGTYALTPGTRYWVMLSNADANPSTNYFAPSYFSGPVAPLWTNGSAATSTNSGTSWSYTQAGDNCRFDFADGNHSGFIVTSVVTLTTATQRVYQSNVSGVRFTLPSNASLRVAGISKPFKTNGTPTGNLLYNLYDVNHNLLASSYAIPNAVALTVVGNWYESLLNPATINGGASTITLAGGNTYTVGIAETTQLDSAGNFYCDYGYTWDADATSQTLIPWSMEFDYFNGTSWTQTPGLICPFALLLANGNEFASSGGRRPRPWLAGV